MIADYTLDIELSGSPVWADRAKRGVFSRDLNTRGRNEAFAVQSPVIEKTSELSMLPERRWKLSG